jgi:ribonucleoside-triphosphate reductase (thioredoxin)
MGKREVKWGDLGYITYKRTYSRRKKDGTTEEFEDTVERELRGIDKQLKLHLTEEEKEFYRDMRFGMKGSVAGRFMWQLGTKTVDKLGLPSLQNCAFTVIDEPIRPFTWAYELLMLGSGVGFSIKKEHVYQLPKLKRGKIAIIRQDDASADFIVPDTREGWVKLLGKVLKAFFYSGQGFTYSVQLVRGKGSPIKGFGGVASGAEVMVDGIDSIIKVLDSRRGQKLRPIDCLDIMNIIGSIVVSGNVRRSAQLAIGDFDDIEYLRAKRWDLGAIPNWRAMSNNSVDCPDTNLLTQDFWDTYKQGEPYGLVNIDLSRRVGRLGDTRFQDPDVQGYNPCAEQSLADKETCCLAEIYLSNISSLEEMKQVATMLYKVNKHSLALGCHLKDTESIVHKNMRMGIGITGYAMSSEEQKSWLSPTYEYLREFDKKYSAEHGFNESIKITTVKPSGTLSLLAGLTSGIHPATAGCYFIRRISVASNSELIEVCRRQGYHMEYKKNFDGTDDKTTFIVEFPCSYPEGTPSGKDVDVLDQLRDVQFMQKNWSDNSVSVTAYYKLEDLDRIKKFLDGNWKDGFKSLSFLLYSGHGFVQAPFEEITKEKYLELKSKTTPITSVTIDESDVSGIDECAGGACPIK